MYDTYKIVMKHVHITLEDKEYNLLIKLKKNTTWHDFLMRDLDG